MENEDEIDYLLVKAVKDNIDKFEKVDGKYLFEDLVVKGRIEKCVFSRNTHIAVTITYKNLSSKYQISELTWYRLKEDYNDGKKIDDIFFNLEESYEKRQKDKFIEQQKQELEELKKLCNTKN